MREFILTSQLPSRMSLSYRLVRHARDAFGPREFLKMFQSFLNCVAHLSLDTRKPVFGVFDQGRLKPTCSSSEAR